MPISGLVLTLAGAQQAEAVLAALGTDPRIEIGDRCGLRQAIAVDAESQDDDKSIWSWLNGLDGVVFIDVVFVAFDQDEKKSMIAPAFERSTTQPTTDPVTVGSDAPGRSGS